jgi:hypothetical protein
MMSIEVQLTAASKPIPYLKVINTYTKGGMYCILYKSETGLKVDKYPLCSIFRVKEDYE